MTCNKGFDRLQRLQAHQSKSSCGTSCTRCKHKFRTRAELSKHQKNAVLKSCDICNLNFCRLIEYHHHQKEAHGMNPNKCTTCSKEFRRYQELEQHQKNAVHADCDICDRKFCSEKDYINHQSLDHHINPLKCKTCGKEHKQLSDLKKHLLKAVPQACDLCDQTLCSLSDYNRHRIIFHRGGEIEPEDVEYQNILDEPIFAPTGAEEEVEYKATVERNYSEIKDKIEDKSGSYAVINRELAPGFTFRELRDQLAESLLKHGRCAKFNIGFGFLLEHKLTHEFRYYYVSTNTMLFEKAHTISKRKDIKDIIKMIHDMNVGEHYFLMRPNSSWMVAGVTNMKFKLFYLGPVLG